MADILELKFVGNNISPSVVKPHEIAELIINFEKALLSTVKEQHSEIDIEEHLFSFESIEHESLDLIFKPIKIPELIAASYTLISMSINEGNYSSLNNDAITNLRAITRFSKKYNCSGYFNLNGETLSTFTPSTEIALNKNNLVKEQTTIFGKLIDAGGEKPNVHIKINDDYILIFDTSEANAKILANKLYEKVALTGIAKWNPITSEVEEFKLNEILEYSPGKTAKAIGNLRDLSSGFWDKFNTNEEINNQLLRD